MTMSVLPKIMVAPNGARKTHKDHPALPMNLIEMVAEARRCFAAGAEALHAHVRNKDGGHTLDAGLYKELLQEFEQQVPQMMVQITTEAVGMYTAEEQRALVRAVRPRCVSIAVREMTPDQNPTILTDFYHELSADDVNVQHILYAPEEIDKLAELMRSNIIPTKNAELLLVLGRYQKDQESQPSDLTPFIEILPNLPMQLPWGVCAFGKSETACLQSAISLGGKARIGFENNFHNSDGSIAEGNWERVAELRAAIDSMPNQ